MSIRKSLVVLGLIASSVACGADRGPVTVTVALDFGTDEAAYLAHAEAFADVEQASEGTVRFRLVRGTTGQIVASVDAGLDNGGVAGATGTLDGGRLHYLTSYWSGRRPVVTHEILHLILGPEHSSTPGDIMCYCSKEPDRRMSAAEVARVRNLLRAWALARGGRLPS